MLGTTNPTKSTNNLANSPTNTYYEVGVSNQFAINSCKSQHFSTGLTPNYSNVLKNPINKKQHLIKSTRNNTIDTNAPRESKNDIKTLVNGLESKIVAPKRRMLATSKSTQIFTKKDDYIRNFKKNKGSINSDNVFRIENDNKPEEKRFMSAKSTNPYYKSEIATSAGFYRMDPANITKRNLGLPANNNQKEHTYFAFKKCFEDTPKDIRRFPNFYFMYKHKRGKYINDFNKKNKSERM